MKKKLLSLGLSLISLSSIYASTVTINNHVLEDGRPVDLSNVDIRLIAGNDWINLGNIPKGQHEFNINTPNTSLPGILRIQIGNDHYYTVVFQKNNAENFYINISNSYLNPKGALKTSVNTNRALSLGSTVNGQDTIVSTIAKKSENAWSSDCVKSDGEFACSINSSPQIIFDSKNLRGKARDGQMDFTFVSNYTVDQLLNLGTVSFSGVGTPVGGLISWDRGTSSAYGALSSIFGSFTGKGRFFLPTQSTQTE
ncbi:hypothetical protein Psal006b_02935 [Piscirickettsia salmonis]|uniref:NUDIX hydrolase n=1 Tax=Piscirickettsia salmonis TaxID=1238 RepID=A0A1L6TGD3_PISSA|nr:hypothetical protein [Piscirickettsia salmonis]AKP72856.1 hypothetical protein PSLF89_762 [Piscirickettsia salmonis LF-89 = ATCC VR-1361]ALB21471.1 NUDIX hydrolase [Piscirickettsia salmonis]ALY01694.1 hypothetical protein AWE47_01430 [Piscirickettsia salmonis]AMA41210.1 hypothetical protein AWJ11_01440 [Piscirickettsia salmonis]AOS36399.1 hypothetical protein AVM72_14425 [Piscirickettsia salmonis]